MNSQTYLVGGAVRDRLLNLPVLERDYVVVGSTEAEMKSLGFRPVGSFFPVFLHPQTNEEYALARTERKSGDGHTGFEVFASPEVTLEEDLARRDLTINAIAEDDAGNLIDPYKGLADIDNRCLRHVSIAFTEDPLRVLRLARFKAKLHHLGFKIADETLSLITRMVAEDALSELSVERVANELNKSLETRTPSEFFRTLQSAGANEKLWPELDGASIDSLDELNAEDHSITVCFCQLTKSLPLPAIDSLCERLKLSNHQSNLALLVNQHLETWREVENLSPAEVLNFILAMDGIRNPDRYLELNGICQVVTDTKSEKTLRLWQHYHQLVVSIRAADVLRQDSKLKGPAIGEAIHQAQINAITAYQST